MPLPAGQETEEIERRAQQTRKFGQKVEAGIDYTRIAQQQRDNVKSQARPKHPLDATFDLSVDRIQRLGSLLARGKHIEHFTMKEAEAFVQLFGEQLETRLNETLRTFIKEKMSK